LEDAVIFLETSLSGAYIVEIEKHFDQRGFFARGWCQQEFETQGLDSQIVQSNISFSKEMGTIRGMHYQHAPYQESKLIRCTRGSIFDVIIDLRSDSPTLGQWFGVELNEKNYRMLNVPKDFAHGFQTLTDNTEVTYLVSQIYMPGAEVGLRFDDQAVGIEWPLPVSVISDKDKNWPDYEFL
jgi:dTDP-4-dehydrorhamnose 3,5-epimerase